jgi:hypothetical protein
VKYYAKIIIFNQDIIETILIMKRGIGVCCSNNAIIGVALIFDAING